MDTGKLEKFAQAARRQLREQVAARMEQVLREDSAVLREQAKALAQLKEKIDQSSKQAVIDRAAYTWFNRFAALRYMDVNFYNPVRIVSPQEGYTQPEILQDAKTGVIDESLRLDKQRLIGLLNGEITSPNPQREVYRLLLLGKCQQLHDDLPFLFPEIEDFTALLLPEDLLSENSILQAVRNNLGQEDCKDVEVIGWLYQFYISERKDEVMGSKKKIQAEDIPAATQLFTPHWIVRYLVENSLGRLWLLNYPDSNIRELMDYYIEPVEEEEEYLEVSSPEELKICDPACGSGHMLTYAFDLLYAIYEEQGYTPSEIPGLILEKNLFGMEISERAGHLAAFALMMKAREKDYRFFEKGIEPNICVFENVEFTDLELKNYKKEVGEDMLTPEFELTIKQFEQAKNFGSLMQPKLEESKDLSERFLAYGFFEDLFLHRTHKKLIRVLDYGIYLCSRYHILVTNPPYLGGRNMNRVLKEYTREHYTVSSSDLFSVFIERGISLLREKAFLAMITMQSWMFLSSFEKLRLSILENNVIRTLSHLGPRAFDTISGEVVSTAAFVFEKNNRNSHRKGIFFRLVYGRNEYEKKSLLKSAIRNSGREDTNTKHIISNSAFKKIPGVPIAYWISSNLLSTFDNKLLGAHLNGKTGVTTGDNPKYYRFWFEVSIDGVNFEANNRHETIGDTHKWYPLNTGGKYTKWYGNRQKIILWANDGQKIRSRPNSYVRNHDYYFKEGITWNKISSSRLGVRFSPAGSIFDAVGLMGFPKAELLKYVLGLLNSNLINQYIQLFNPTMSILIGDLNRIPFVLSEEKLKTIDDNVNIIIEKSKEIWDDLEISWGFKKSPLVRFNQKENALSKKFEKRNIHCKDTVLDIQNREIENNNIFSDIYGLQDEVDPEVPLNNITLMCNPEFRYGENRTEKELFSMFREDSIRELLSYSVGCIFGRYSLDKPGLILANQGDTLDTYLAQISDPVFIPDEDNVIPVLDEGWFSDDITARFKDFLRVTFGDENLTENLDFLEKAIGRDIRTFFLVDFFNYHCKMYKGCPIYWMFESPKGYFKALIYMHRYTKDTVSIVLNDYLREFRAKLQAQRTHLERQKDNGSKQEQAQAEKERERIREMLADLKEYENDILYPLATQQIEIDLDDGVDVNYPKFGKALAPR